jgi:hypothetical protein
MITVITVEKQQLYVDTGAAFRRRTANALIIVPCPQCNIGVFTFFHPRSR